VKTRRRKTNQDKKYLTCLFPMYHGTMRDEALLDVYRTEARVANPGYGIINEKWTYGIEADIFAIEMKRFR